MEWQFIANKFTYFKQKFKQKKTRFLLSVITSISGWWISMLTANPTFGAVGITLTIYLILLIVWDEIVPCNKLKVYWNYIIPAIITLIIVWPFWSRLVGLFPSPYKQPLRTGRADIEVTVEPNGVINSGIHRFGYGYISLVKDGNAILEMKGWAGCEQVENGQAIYTVPLELDAKDKSINKPICYLAEEAEYAVIWFEKLPPKSKVISGKVIFTFNSLVRFEIPIPPQTMEDDAIIIQDVQKHLRKGS